ncbi:hypothetical protein ACTXNW_08830 [Enterococcus malodoratus]|uniref:hypothetical protein n=1 Tax=Enterococcus malodoratus TaxID=71451 RepID=UPI003FD0BE6D
MKVKNGTNERTNFTNHMMQANAPHSKTDYFEIDGYINFVRTYDLTNRETPFYFSFSQKNKMPVSDEMILEIMVSDLIHHELIAQYKLQESISENNVTHIFPISKKPKEEK